VTEAVWVQSWNGCELGLVSGAQMVSGQQSSSRLPALTIWMDVRLRALVGRAEVGVRFTEREILMQADYDIGHFSLGDVYKGEKPLVV